MSSDVSQALRNGDLLPQSSKDIVFEFVEHISKKQGSESKQLEVMANDLSEKLASVKPKKPASKGRLSMAYISASDRVLLAKDCEL